MDDVTGRAIYTYEISGTPGRVFKYRIFVYFDGECIAEVGTETLWGAKHAARRAARIHRRAFRASGTLRLR